MPIIPLPPELASGLVLVYAHAGLVAIGLADGSFSGQIRF
jgi:hypothetical protein